MDIRVKKSVPVLLAAGVRGLWLRLRQWLLNPRSITEDDRRKEFILNVILLSGLALLTVFDLCILYDSVVMEGDYRGVSFLIFSIPVVVVGGLLALSRAGYFKWSAYVTLVIFFAIIFYSARAWGMDLPAVLLGYALVVTAASVLIGTRFGFWVACAGVLVLAYSGYQEIQGAVLPDHYWKLKVLRLDNVIEYSVMLFYLALISGLSNSEIDKSLNRARRSEAELKQERDNLEITVEHRTRELRHSQLARLAEHAQFVELGQLASGYVHDLVNPLTTLSLSMDQLKASEFGQASTALQSALNAGKRMSGLLVTLRKQIRQDQGCERFFLGQELADAVELLGYTAKKAGVAIKLNLPVTDVEYYGSASKFHQIASNLLTNAIESSALELAADLRVDDGLIRFAVSDNGSGIAKENIDKIFEPFFTTKNGTGLGIGLPTIKTIIEKDFNGSIQVSSKLGQGTVFVVSFPLRVN